MGDRLAGKRVLVTGATSGIGRAIALAMAAEGARIAVHGRSAARAEPVAEELRARGGEAFGPPRPDPTGPEDWRRLAALHCESLPESAVAVLGERYAERFYRYLAGSEREHAFLHRDAGGALEAVCVVSLDPSGLNRRLWCSTPLLPALLRGAAGTRRRALAGALSASPRAHRYESDEGAPRSLDAPEIIVVFVAPGRRRRGLGLAIVARARAWLRAAGQRRCLARTLDDPRNRAAAFYRAAGFELRGRSLRRGFQVWESAV